MSFIVTFGTAAGCAVDTPDQEPAQEEVQEARGRTGKADLPGTCNENQCGGKGDGQCWCDEKCSDYDDCCFNVNDVCETANDCVNDNDCADGFCGWGEDNTTRICKDWAGQGESCEGFVLPSFRAKCAPGLQCIQTEPTGDVPGTCNVGPIVNPPPPPPPLECDPLKICTYVITCVNGQNYPTGCGADNCDKPMGPCPTVNPPPPPPPPPPSTSCQDKCGGPADAAKSCFCDTACSQYGDCCEDYTQQCAA